MVCETFGWVAAPELPAVRQQLILSLFRHVSELPHLPQHRSCHRRCQSLISCHPPMQLAAGNPRASGYLDTGHLHCTGRGMGGLGDL